MFKSGVKGRRGLHFVSFCMGNLEELVTLWEGNGSGGWGGHLGGQEPILTIVPHQSQLPPFLPTLRRERGHAVTPPLSLLRIG